MFTKIWGWLIEPYKKYKRRKEMKKKLKKLQEQDPFIYE